MNVGRQAVRAVVVIFSVCLTGGITAPILAQGWGPWGGGGGERRVPQPSGQWGEWGGGERRVPQSPTLPMPMPVPMPVVKPENLQRQIVVTGRTENCRECIVREILKEYRNNGITPETISVTESRTRTNTISVNAGFNVEFVSASLDVEVGESHGADYTASLTVPPNHTGMLVGFDYYRKTDFQIVSGGRVIDQGTAMEYIKSKTTGHLIPPGGSRRSGRGIYPTGGGVTPY